MEGDAQLYVQDDTGNYVEYTPPEPKAFNETLPEDLRESEHLKDVKDSSELARYYVDLKSNYLKPPDTAEGYEFQKPDDYQLDEETFKAFRQQAFEVGLNQKQFDTVMKAEVARFQKGVQAIEETAQAHRTEAENALKTEWGDNYEKNVEAAKSVINHEKLASPEFKQFLNDTRFGDNPEVIKFFHRLSSAISEDSFIKPGSGIGDQTVPKVGEDGRPMLHFPSMEGQK